MNIMKRIARLVLTALLVALPIGLAQAAVVDMKNAPQLKTHTLLPQAEFEGRTDLYHGDPNDDVRIEYDVRLPKGWQKEKATGAAVPAKGAVDGLNANVLQRVARYVSPAKMHRRSYLSVESQELTYEIGARNWFLNYFLNTGHTLRGINGGNEANTEVEAEYVELQGDITYLVRVKTVINGPRVIMARYYMPVELYDAEHVLQAQSVSSFHLTGQKMDQIEERRTHGFLDQTYFDFPVSWILRAPKVVNVDRMRAMIYNPGPGGKMNGQINIYVTSRYIDTTLAEEVRLYRENLSIPEYAVGKKVENVTLPVHQNMEMYKTEVYELQPAKTFMLAYELWVTVMQSEGYYYIISMLTPARTADFYQWARNGRAYEIVLATTRQFDPNIDRYQYAQ